jgi:hypothetical protein
MKKNYNYAATFLAAIALSANVANAQLSGTVTIDKSIPTGGTNYQSFTDLATALNGPLGINGPLTVNVVPNSGPYNEQVTFNQAIGSSALNTILIEGNGNTITFNSTTGNPNTIGLNGADFMTFRNLNIYATNPSSGMAVHLYNIANNNTFEGCWMDAPLGGTSTNASAFVMSGSQTSPTTIGNSGSNNTVITCTTNGGYYGNVIYGSSGAPFTTNNNIINSVLRNSFAYNLFHAYNQSSVFRGNIVERPDITASTTGAGFYMSTSSLNYTITGNRIRSFYDNLQTSTGTYYGIYTIAGATGSVNVITNNIITDYNHFGTIYGIFMSTGNFINCDHNTIDIGNPGYTGTSGAFGIYCSGGGNSQNVRNNIVTMTRGGNANKYCLYTTVANTNINFNNFTIPSSATNFIGYYLANYSTLALLQGAGSNLNSVSIDPMYLNVGAQNYLPTNPALNNLGTPAASITVDYNAASRSALTPDMGALEFLDLPCFGTPNQSSVLTSTVVECPGVSLGVSLSNSYTLAGTNFSWVTSTVSAFGPWTAVSGATNQAAIVPTIGQNTWISASITCFNSGLSTNATAALIQIAGTTTNSVPYLETFEGVSSNNRYPNCSWSSSNPSITCQTYTISGSGNRTPQNGARFGSFKAPTAPNGDYFYTNGIYMEPGITYSASLGYITDGALTWNELSILLGTTQTVPSLTNIVTAGPGLINTYYKTLNNTFTVGTAGLYYVAIKCRGNGTGFLCIDDVSINAPCHLNSPALSISPSGGVSGCIGQSVILNASGASSYLWNNSVSTASLSYLVTGNGNITVVGTSSASGCSATVNIPVSANLSPQVGIIVPNTTLCRGSSMVLTAYGANNYAWTNGANTATTVVSPTVNTTYTVIGINSFGCSASVAQLITVKNLPTISALGSAETICAGESATLTATGALTYTWSSNNIFLVGSQVVVTPIAASTSYTVVGSDLSNCQAKNFVNLNTSACVGLNENSSSLTQLNIHPNPNNGVFTLELNSGEQHSLQVVDVTGRVVYTADHASHETKIYLPEISAGIYYVKISNKENSKTLKFIKE